ncbi:unnamed protein product [Caenorhabditis auriculariae]|uniref:Uncharacterized protein n=1 Tax=Caenorhabditis auriculariae TaxID=2777116 RepID=A0A8S1GUJ3_9PELO|nr:unnamed protein product [Caenorhabditis auriculariae]
MCIRFLALGFVVFVQFQLISSLYVKRASDFEDPRMFSSAFGKRSNGGWDEDRVITVGLQKRSNDFEDPRFMSMAFGKRSMLPLLGNLHRYAVFEKRSTDVEDPRFFSGAFGRKK